MNENSIKPKYRLVVDDNEISFENMINKLLDEGYRIYEPLRVERDDIGDIYFIMQMIYDGEWCEASHLL